MQRSLAVLIAVFSAAIVPAHAADPNHVHQLLQRRQCTRCDLADTDLVQADLRDADLSQASLQRANLSGVNLDGAKLQQADLSFTSLKGASLRGADLRGSRLYGTDLRQADLSGAYLDPGALEQSHWLGAKGIGPEIRSHATLHNAGVDAAQLERWREAEDLFSKAIERKPSEPLSWVARGISRGQQGKHERASQDLAYAGALFERRGEQRNAEQLRSLSQQILPGQTNSSVDGNGVGSTLLGGTLSILQNLAPLAIKALTPLIP